MNNLIKHIQNSMIRTNNFSSKVTHELLHMYGLSGKKTRHFYNNLCSMNDARYLEIGTWTGSSICSAMCKNKMRCVGIDNWSEFGNIKNEFLKNFNKYKGQNDATFIEKNCWDVDVNSLGKFNIYMYDGKHDEKSHYQALNYYLPCLDDEFIYLVDDWNWKAVRDGTLKSIRDNCCNILYRKEIKTTVDNSHAYPSGPKSNWHNGIGIFVLKKQLR